MQNLDEPNCCGRKINTPYCPNCGRKQFIPSDPQALLSYLKSQRNRTSAWVQRCEKSQSVLSEEERNRRNSKYYETLKRWDAWIFWVKNKLEEKGSEHGES